MLYKKYREFRRVFGLVVFRCIQSDIYMNVELNTAVLGPNTDNVNHITGLCLTNFFHEYLYAT